MKERVQEGVWSRHEAPHARQAAVPAGLGVQTLRAWLAKGRPEVRKVADLIDTHPGERTAIVELLHRTVGNGYVVEVMWELQSRHEQTHAAPSAAATAELSATLDVASTNARAGLDPTGIVGEPSLDDRAIVERFQTNTAEPARVGGASGDLLFRQINHELIAIGAPPLALVVDDEYAGGAVFEAASWAVRAPPSMFASGELDAVVVSLIYHEARHAEQWFRMARLLAGRGVTAAAIAERLDLGPNVVALAVARPLRDGPEAKEAEGWLRAVESEKTGEAMEKAAASLSNGEASRVAEDLEIARDRGRDDDERKRAFKALKTYFRAQLDYFSIPFERDAYMVGALASGTKGGDVTEFAQAMLTMSFDEFDAKLGHVGATPRAP